MKKLIVIFYYNIIILYNNNNNMNLSKTRTLRTTKKTRKNQQTGGSQYKYLHNKLDVKKQSLDKNLKKVFEEFLETILKNKSSRLNNIVKKYGGVYKIPGAYGKQILIGVSLLYFNFIGFIKSKSSSKDLHLTLINIYQLLLGLSLIRTVMDTYRKKKSTNTILTKLGKNLYGLLPRDIKMRDINILMFNNILIYLYIVFCYVLDSLGLLINFEFPQNYYNNLSFVGNSSYKDKKTFEINFRTPRTSFLTEWEKQISKIRRELNHPNIKKLLNKLEVKFKLIDKTNYDRKSSKLKNKLKDIYKDIETLKNLSEGRRGTSRNSREISDENLSTLILLMHKKMCKAYYLYKDLQETKNIDDDDIESFFKYYFRMYDGVIKKTSESNNSKELLDFFYNIDFKITDSDNPYNGLYKEMGTNKLGRLIDKINMAFVSKIKSI
jgi:hypothetical protein